MKIIFIQNIIVDESELKNLLEFAELLSFYRGKEITNKENVGKILFHKNYDEYMTTIENFELDQKLCSSEFKSTKEKILNIFECSKNSLHYPYNIMFEYANSVYNVMELEEENEKEKNIIEEVSE